MVVNYQSKSRVPGPELDLPLESPPPPLLFPVTAPLLLGSPQPFLLPFTHTPAPHIYRISSIHPRRSHALSGPHGSRHRRSIQTTATIPPVGVAPPVIHLAHPFALRMFSGAGVDRAVPQSSMRGRGVEGRRGTDLPCRLRRRRRERSLSSLTAAPHSRRRCEEPP